MTSSINITMWLSEKFQNTNGRFLVLVNVTYEKHVFSSIKHLQLLKRWMHALKMLLQQIIARYNRQIIGKVTIRMKLCFLVHWYTLVHGYTFMFLNHI